MFCELQLQPGDGLRLQRAGELLDGLPLLSLVRVPAALNPHAHATALHPAAAVGQQEGQGCKRRRAQALPSQAGWDEDIRPSSHARPVAQVRLPKLLAKACLLQVWPYI